MLLAATPPGPAGRYGVRVTGAEITGGLSLSHVGVAVPLQFRNCAFDTPLDLTGAALPFLDVSGSTFPGLRGEGLRVDVGLLLAECIVDGPVHLTDARIGGSLRMDGATIDGHGDVGFIADNVHLSGRLWAENLVIKGTFRMHNGDVSGSIGFWGAELHSPGGYALRLGGLRCRGGVFCSGGFRAIGAIRAIGVELSHLTLRNASLSAPDDLALDLTDARIARLDAGEDLRVTGVLCLRNARISGTADLTGAGLNAGPDRIALDAEALEVGDSLVLSEVHATGGFNLLTARIGARVYLRNARVSAAGKQIAFRGSRLRVGADLFAERTVFDGEVRLSGAHVGDNILFGDAVLRNGTDTALRAEGMQARYLDLLFAEQAQGNVNLQHAQVNVLRDDPSTWPAVLKLNGFVYDTLQPRENATVEKRLAWLARNEGSFQPQPFEQLAAYYTSVGNDADARRVLLRKEREYRAAQPAAGRIWSHAQDVTVGYGYQPWRAVSWLLAFLIAGSVVYGLSPPVAVKPAEAPPFNAVVYTLDLLLPIGDLGQQRAFNAAGPSQWLSYLLMVAGWVLVTTIAAGVARVLSRK
ncbi:hypothetical protein [Nonomuraea zeae]|uniref:Oxidoreductase n=1 Tax=Nonomuraea zeae TaxID=1642303 RepID=A0A5S4GTS1_9ACTN|nr:hypothetical protein [Nonomuraea zeae]TMR36239.1 hypothetical protein ETD85_11580 [Nonomuraea zeae]